MNNMKVSTRLAWGFGTLIALLLLIVLVGLLRMSAINDSLDSVLHDRVPKVAKLEEISFKAMDNARIVRNIVLLTDEKAMASNKVVYDKNILDINENIAYLEKYVNLPAAVELLKALKRSQAAYLVYTQEVLELGLANKIEEATKVLYGDKYKSQDAYFSDIRKFVDLQKSVMDTAGKAATASYHSARIILLVAGALAILLGVVMAVLITRSIGKQLGGEPSDAASMAQAVAQGDLTRRVELKTGDSSSLMYQLKTM
jgi:methyl-accepting chemotaxis protein